MKLRFQQGDISAVANPPADQFIVMYDLDGKLKQKDSTGVITEIGSGTGGGSLKRSYKQALPDNLTAGDTNLYVINDTILEVDNPSSDYSLKYLDTEDVEQVIPFVYGRSYHAKISAIKRLANGAIRAISSISSLYSIDDYANTVGEFNIGTGVGITNDFYDKSVCALNSYNGLKAWVSFFNTQSSYFTSVYKGGPAQPLHLIGEDGVELTIAPAVLSAVAGAVSMIKVGNGGHVYLGVDDTSYPWSDLYKVYEDGSGFVAGFASAINDPIQIASIVDLASDSTRIFVLSNGGGTPYIDGQVSVLNDTTGALITSLILPNAYSGPWDRIISIGDDKYLVLQRPNLTDNTRADIKVLHFTTGPDALTDITAAFIANLNSVGIFLQDIVDIGYYGGGVLVSVNNSEKLIRISSGGLVVPDSTPTSIANRLDADEFIIRLGSDTASQYFITNKHPYIKSYQITEGLVTNFAKLDSADLKNNGFDSLGTNLLVTGTKNIVNGVMLVQSFVNSTLTDNPPKFMESSVLVKSEPQDKVYTKIPKLSVNADDELTLDLGEQVDTVVVSVEILETVGQYNPLGITT